MTLHDAITEILRDFRCPMGTSEIADEVNKRGSYRKGDGNAVTAFQIHGRTRNYRKLFGREGSTVTLTEWGEGHPASRRNHPTPSDSDAPSKGASEAGSAIAVTEESDVGRIEFLEKEGFLNLGTLRQLMEDWPPDPQSDHLSSCGVYAITLPGSFRAIYISPKEANENGNVLRPWTVEKLTEKWVAGTEILYYGLAGMRSERSLSERIDDLLQHGAGKLTSNGPHGGGEIMWQLCGVLDMSLWCLGTTGPPVPRETERVLLKAFKKNYGSLPFANRRMWLVDSTCRCWLTTSVCDTGCLVAHSVTRREPISSTERQQSGTAPSPSVSSAVMTLG
jgi:hypothetical protein